jgi:hypothetical protein
VHAQPAALFDGMEKVGLIESGDAMEEAGRRLFKGVIDIHATGGSRWLPES